MFYRLTTATIFLLVISLFHGVAIGTEIDHGEPLAVARAGLDAWQQENWDSFYALLSTADKEAMELYDFQERQRAFADSYTRLKGYEIHGFSVRGEGLGAVQLTQYVDEGPSTRYWPSDDWRPTENETEWQLVREADGWKIHLGLKPTPPEPIPESYQKLPFKFKLDK